MKRSDRLLLAPLALAALCCALLAARVASQLGGARLELGRARLATVDAAARARLLALEEPATAIWYRTPPAGMPSHLRALERGVRDCLAALRDASDGRFEFHVADPDAHPEWSEALASAGIAPWRARRIERDGWREERVWSSLSIAYGPRPAAVIHALGPRELPALQRLILAELEELAHPRRPVVALAAPAGFERFRAELARGADVEALDFESGAELPERADLFVWLAPRACSERELAALDRFRARGGSVLVAGGAWEARVEPAAPAELERVELRSSGFPVARFLAHHGLRALEGIVLDARDAGLARPTFRVPCPAPDQDFRTLRGQPNGTLVFDAPTVFEPDATALAARGLAVALLGAARGSAVRVDATEGSFASASLAARAGRPAAGAALLASLQPSDRWSGALVYASSASPFRDELFEDERSAHRELTRVLLANLLAPERRVAKDIARERPAPIAMLASSERNAWRALIIAIPAALALAPLLARSRKLRRPRWSARPALARFAFLPLALAVAAWLAPARGLSLARDGARHIPAAELDVLAKLVAELAPRGPVALETWFSAGDRLPPELRSRAREAERACAELARRVPGLEHRRLRVGALDPTREAELARSGIPVREASSSAEEATSARRIASAVRVACGGEARVLSLERATDFETLRFRLALALWQLARGREVTIAFAAQTPRLSPAEAALEYQRKGLFAPREGDAYSELGALLLRSGFRVAPIDPGEPPPIAADLLVWIQPRRDATPLLERAANFLRAGGRALIAAQEFRVQARQIQGEELALAFWPQPQFTDLDRHYLPELGLFLARELLFDELIAPLAIETRVDRADGGADYRRIECVQPFLIRAAETGFGPDVPALEGLGDLVFPSASRIAWDEAELARRGLRAETWIRASPRAWTFDWRGGDLPAAVLAGPGASSGAGVALFEPPPLAALFRGRFPGAVRRQASQGGAELALAPPDPSAPEGALLLVGCSEMWRNELLYEPRFRHELFALRAAAELALPPEIAAFLHHRAAPPGLGLVEPRARVRWRVGVIAAFPFALLVFGALRKRSR